MATPARRPRADRLFRHAHGTEMVEADAEQQPTGHHQDDGRGHAQPRHAPGRRHVGPGLKDHREDAERRRAHR